ncbi:hypothetical protein DZF91_00495 [Actinomadura logoneensis]|uniref:Uncharacterized protein n=1 Tax=Actinomadura logoneensis TaxID=2293572 RepID=A0A372JU39_9ACTN|nr:hypothetical protein [Actinomadura logoneensis]RFU43551.1 hypothetical protein DZF91_00495 [Actinomadura logoneensis]
MESKLEEMLARRIGELADEAHPLSVGSDELTRRVRRRRRVRNTTIVAVAGAAAATAVGIPQIWAATRPAGHPGPTTSTSRDIMVAVAPPPGVDAPPKFCGAPRRTSPAAPSPGSSGPPDQPALGRAAATIQNVVGGGKEVTKNGRRPGPLERWYAGLAMDTAWRKVVVYRLPSDRLDTAVCGAVRDVTVEIRGAYRNEADAQRLVSQIMAQPKQPTFEIFGIGPLPDGRIEVSTDHPGEAVKALSHYGPGITARQATSPSPLNGGNTLGPARNAPSGGLTTTSPRTTPS